MYRTFWQNALTPGRRRQLVAHVQASHGISERSSCLALGVDRSSVRALTVVDAFIWEALAINVDRGIKGEQVVAAMTRILSICGAARTIRVDNGSEFISKALERWAYESGVTLDFSHPGKRTDNAFVKSFNGRIRDECLKTDFICCMEQAGFVEKDQCLSRSQEWAFD